METTPQRTPAAHLISTDIALQWAQTIASEWAPRHPVQGLSADDSPTRIRDGVLAAATSGAQEMARAGGKTQDLLSADPDEIRKWLLWCCDQVAEPDRTTPIERTMERLSGRGASRDGLRPLRRWQGAVRLQLQQLGISWLRGRDSGECALTVAVTGTHGTRVIEHGWAQDEAGLQSRLLPTVVEALDQQAQWLGKEAPPKAEGLTLFETEVRRCCTVPELQSPDWVLAPAEPSTPGS